MSVIFNQLIVRNINKHIKLTKGFKGVPFLSSDFSVKYPQVKLVITLSMDSKERSNVAPEKKEDHEHDIAKRQSGSSLRENDSYSVETDFSNLSVEAQVSASNKSVNCPEDVEVWKSIKSQQLGHAEYPDIKIFRNRHLTDATTVFRHNAWDDVEWDDERQADAAAAVLKNSSRFVEPEKLVELEENAYRHWDKFYGIHQNKFFRDRNWLFSEFPELESPFGCSVNIEESHKEIKSKRRNEIYPGGNSKFKVLEVGCGAGNTIFPLLAANNNPETYVYACDFSPTAVEIVQNHTKFESDRCTAFVLDATFQNPRIPFELGSIDVITMIFVISAITPEKFDQVLQNMFSFLKPGGVVLFRDYGRYDMAQLRFKEGRCLSENFYARGDNTRVYFFTEEEVAALFQRNGFIKDKLLVDKRLQVNRGKQLKMYRVWIQGKFRKPL